MQLSIGLQGIVTQQLLPTADGSGRVVACEVMVPTPAVRNLIREGKTHQIYSTIQTSGATGMQTMDADLARLVHAGQINRKLAEQRASVPEELSRLIGGATPGAARDAGSSPARARDRRRKVFDRLFRSMVRSGEQSGRLEDALERVAFQFEKLDALRRQIRSAMMYPAFVFGLALVVLVVVVAFIVPIFAGVYEEIAADTPGASAELPF